MEMNEFENTEYREKTLAVNIMDLIMHFHRTLSAGRTYIFLESATPILNSFVEKQFQNLQNSLSLKVCCLRQKKIFFLKTDFFHVL